jgi:hypothetical protein
MPSYQMQHTLQSKCFIMFFDTEIAALPACYLLFHRSPFLYNSEGGADPERLSTTLCHRVKVLVQQHEADQLQQQQQQQQEEGIPIPEQPSTSGKGSGPRCLLLRDFFGHVPLPAVESVVLQPEHAGRAEP